MVLIQQPLIEDFHRKLKGKVREKSSGIVQQVSPRTFSIFFLSKLIKRSFYPEILTLLNFTEHQLIPQSIFPNDSSFHFSLL